MWIVSLRRLTHLFAAGSPNSWAPRSSPVGSAPASGSAGGGDGAGVACAPVAGGAVGTAVAAGVGVAVGTGVAVAVGVGVADVVGGGEGVGVDVGASAPVALQAKPVVIAAPWKALSAPPFGRNVATNRYVRCWPGSSAPTSVGSICLSVPE